MYKRQVQGDLSSLFTPVRHEVPLESLQDVFSLEELREFDRRVRETVSDPTYVVEPKIDGLSIALELSLIHIKMCIRDSIMACDIANVRQTLDEMPREVFNAAVDAIVNARRVYIFGAGSCRALANFIAYYLKMLLVDIHLIYTSSETEIFEEMLHIDERDAIIGVSFPRYSSKRCV